MSLDAHTCVTATCDGCREVFGIDHDTHFCNQRDALDAVLAEGWILTETHRLLCDECAAACSTGDHAWREHTAQPGVFGPEQHFPEPFESCGRCEVIRRGGPPLDDVDAAMAFELAQARDWT